MNEDLIYSITPEEDERAKALRDKDRERGTALKERLAGAYNLTGPIRYAAKVREYNRKAKKLRAE